MPREFEYLRPQTRTEALELLARPDTRTIPLIVRPKPNAPRRQGADAFIDLSLLELDAIQAGILRAKLRHLPDWNQSRRDRALRYDELLSQVDGLLTPFVPPWAKAVFHLYVVRAQRRDALQSYLSENGVATGLHYPVPLHLQKAYAGLGYKKGDFPVSEKAAEEILSLPLFPELSPEQQEHVAHAIRQFLSLSP